MADWRRREGRRAEQLAAEWYEAAGYEVLDRNWRCRDGEIDLVCRLGGTVVVCEVKARRSTAAGTPADAVTPAKRRRLRHLAARWLGVHDVRCALVRFDLAAVVGQTVEVLIDAW